MSALITMREALADPQLLGSVMPGDTWKAWRALLIAIMGERLDDEERAIFTALTGREVEPMEMVEEFWAVVGRRGGKTRAAAVLATYFGSFVDHSQKLAQGERGVIPFMAASTRQAAVAYGYAAGIFETVPMLAGLVTNKTAETISLSTGVDLEVRPASYRTARGITAVAAIGDEAAFWRSDNSANPDTEILNAIRPALATTGGPLIVISSPYARRGEVYTNWRRHYGPKGDPLILVAQAPSRTLNPSLPQKVVDRAMERDESSARAEYLAEFRTDIEAFVTREVVEACVSLGVYERAPLSTVHYKAFVDPSGGSADSFTLAIGHLEGTGSKKIAILDAVRETKPPFSPEAVVAEYAELLKRYRVHTIVGDRYAGEWPRESFRNHQITYEPSASPKSDMYRDLLPYLNSGEVDLLENDRIVSQIVGLERRTSRSGKDSIDHAPGGHDDVANAVAGVLSTLKTKGTGYTLDNVGTSEDINRLWRMQQGASW